MHSKRNVALRSLTSSDWDSIVCPSSHVLQLLYKLITKFFVLGKMTRTILMSEVGCQGGYQFNLVRNPVLLFCL